MKFTLFALLVSFCSFAHAQEAPTTSALEFSTEEAQRPPKGLLPYIAFGGGYTGYDTLSSVEGSPATLKLLGSYYFENPFVVDIGYGVNNQQFIQPNSKQDTANTGGAFELAARYRWDNRWQAGVIANQLFEQGKNLSAEQGDAQFAGLQVLREFNVSSSWLGRIGARAMGLTNNTGNLVTMYLVDLQIGWNPGAYKPSVRQMSEENASPMKRDTDYSYTQEETKVEPARPVSMIQPQSAIRDIAFSSLTSTDAAIQFQTAKSTVSEKDQQKLSRLAKVLNENKELYDHIEVHGYTDASGGKSLNQRISQQRADQVRSVLRQEGLRDVKVLSQGKGATASTGNLNADRRAELVIIGVKDETKLREALSGIE